MNCFNHAGSSTTLRRAKQYPISPRPQPQDPPIPFQRQPRPNFGRTLYPHLKLGATPLLQVHTRSSHKPVGKRYFEQSCFCWNESESPDCWFVRDKCNCRRRLEVFDKVIYISTVIVMKKFHYFHAFAVASSCKSRSTRICRVDSAISKRRLDNVKLAFIRSGSVVCENKCYHFVVLSPHGRSQRR